MINFKLKLNSPSKIAELQELEHWKTKFDVASTATEGFFSRQWIASRLFNMTEEEFVKNQRHTMIGSLMLDLKQRQNKHRQMLLLPVEVKKTYLEVTWHRR